MGVKLESSDLYEATGRKNATYFNVLENYAIYVLIPPNIKSVETELNMIAKK